MERNTLSIQKSCYLQFRRFQFTCTTLHSIFSIRTYVFLQCTCSFVLHRSFGFLTFQEGFKSEYCTLLSKFNYAMIYIRNELKLNKTIEKKIRRDFRLWSTSLNIIHILRHFFEACKHFFYQHNIIFKRSFNDLSSYLITRWLT